MGLSLRRGKTDGSTIVASCDLCNDAMKETQASILSMSTNSRAGSCSGSSDTFSDVPARSMRPWCRGSPVVLSFASLKGRSLGKDDAEVW